MDNEKNVNGKDRSELLDDLLTAPDSGSEIQADEHAVASHGMSSISDMELERIMQEAIEANWGEDIFENTSVKDAPIADFSYPEDDQTEESVFDEESEPEDEEPEYAEDDSYVPRKVRPKGKKGYGFFGLPHIASIIIWIVITVFAGSSLGNLVYVCLADILALGRPDQAVSITITETDTLDTITNKLYNAGLVEYPELFKMYCELAKVEEKGKISVGTFNLNTLYDYHALVGGMSATSSYRESVKVMIPEGYTCAQIFKLLEEKGVCSAAELEEYASTSEFTDYWFLEGVTLGHKYCLEGFLFPDTYEFYINDTPKRVFIKFLNNFDRQFTDEMLEQLDALNKRLPVGIHLTLLDLMTVASMIEKESAHSGESLDISSVIYNRLKSPNFPYLNIDATVIYALGGKKELTKEDLAIDHPYNTYKYKGLPPGPISNPGILSIRSALIPNDTQYYYYALDYTSESREHRFFKTYQEHMNFINGQNG